MALGRSLPMDYFEEIWLVDFEFRSPPGCRPEVICLSAKEFRSGRQLLLWADELGKEPPFDMSERSLFVAFYASAELGCFRSLAWAQPKRILDLFAEFRCLTNGLPLISGNGLIGALTHFGLPAIGVEEKKEMRDLVLRGGPYTSGEKASILAYCATDTDALARLLPAMEPRLDLARALLRGRYMSAVSAMEFEGVPLDTETLDRLLSNWSALQRRLIDSVDREYGVYENYTFKRERFERWLAKRGISWPHLESGELDLQSKTFEDEVKIHSEIRNLAELRCSLSEMRLNDLAVGADGCNRCLLSPFRSVTGRNQPSNAKFIFGPSTWMRGLIKPKEGEALAYIDFEQQEFAIAAALSGDPGMKASYLSGDCYLSFAKQAGAVPDDATKESHGDIRDKYKQCVLGVQYGMGEESLGVRIGQSTFEARELLRKHKEVYDEYWKWAENVLNWSLMLREQKTVFGWTAHVGYKPHKRTGLIEPNDKSTVNFFMQANGAEMMRITACLATEAGIRVCAPVHDAFLIAGTLEHIGTKEQPGPVTRKMQEIMREASMAVLDGFEVRTEANIFRYPDRYMDKRGKDFWGKVIGELK